MSLMQQPFQRNHSDYANEIITQLSSKTRCFSRSTVHQHIPSPVYFRCVGATSMTPTTCSTKIPNERTGKTSSSLISTRHRIDP
ncbi:Pentatricopeptide repeat-containing protein [Cardamine amara subsp. amara]|uniref:Pentatricopeptide repeat-containing protein n=1 Tax=Cardamine amara subsp. amara TaxID=228776 RepID=A0ABD0ZY28_CARAN